MWATDVGASIMGRWTVENPRKFSKEASDELELQALRMMMGTCESSSMDRRTFTWLPINNWAISDQYHNPGLT